MFCMTCPRAHSHTPACVRTCVPARTLRADAKRCARALARRRLAARVPTVQRTLRRIFVNQHNISIKLNLLIKITPKQRSGASHDPNVYASRACVPHTRARTHKVRSTRLTARRGGTVRHGHGACEPSASAARLLLCLNLSIGPRARSHRRARTHART